MRLPDVALAFAVVLPAVQVAPPTRSPPTRSVEPQRLDVVVVAAASERGEGERGESERLANGAALSFGPCAATGRPTRDALADFEAAARHATTDAHGLASLPRPDARWLVVARLGRARALAFVAADAPVTAEPLKLVLELVPTLDVAVFDAAHAPVADADVQLLRGVPSWPRPVATATSDAAGHATFRDLDLLDERMLRIDRFGVGLAIAMLDAAMCEVDLHAPPADPVELVVPATGRLTVEVRDADGRAVASGGTVDIAPEYDFQRHFAAPGERSPTLGGDTAPLTDGRVTFGHVAVGVAVAIHATLASGRDLYGRSDGPQGAGDEEVVALTIPAPGPFLAGRLIDAQGGPLRDATLHCVVAMWGEVQMCSGRTDADGRFRVDAAGAPLAERARLIVTIDGGGLRAPHEFTRLGPPVVDGVADLGDVAIPARVELARGVVVDDAGAPCRGITIRAESSGRVDDAARSVTEPQTMVETESDERGAFVLWGPPLPDGSALEASDVHAHELLAPERIPWTSSSPPFTFVMTRTGSIAGRIVLPAGASAKDLALEIARSDATTVGFDRPDIAFDGGFWFDHVAPGSYDLDVAVGAKAEAKIPVAHLSGVVVVAGAPSADPRLATIDLRDRLHGLEIAATTSDGRRVGVGQVMTAPVAGEPQRLLGWIEAGRASLLMTETALDLEVRAKDQRFTIVRGARDHVDVVLPPALRVRFEFGPPDLPIELWQMTSILLGTEHESDASILNRQREGSAHRPDIELAIPKVGTYDLTLEADLPNEPGVCPFAVELPPEIARFVVTDADFAAASSAPKVVRVRLSDESIARAKSGERFVAKPGSR